MGISKVTKRVSKVARTVSEVTGHGDTPGPGKDRDMAPHTATQEYHPLHLDFSCQPGSVLV